MSGIGLATVALIESPGQVAARSAAPHRSVITATVRWEVLRDPIVTAGIVRAARTITVTASAPYAAVTVTRMPVTTIVNRVDGVPSMAKSARFATTKATHTHQKTTGGARRKTSRPPVGADPRGAVVAPGVPGAAGLGWAGPDDTGQTIRTRGSRSA